MRKLASYIAKYGPVEGPKMLTRLQREAGLASAHARHKKRLRRGRHGLQSPGTQQTP